MSGSTSTPSIVLLRHLRSGLLQAGEYTDKLHVLCSHLLGRKLGLASFTMCSYQPVHLRYNHIPKIMVLEPNAGKRKSHLEDSIILEYFHMKLVNINLAIANVYNI